jgi:hypothetical protein
MVINGKAPTYADSGWIAVPIATRWIAVPIATRWIAVPIATRLHKSLAHRRQRGK